jgi:hypothetical protein
MLPGVGHVLQLRISVTNIGSAKMDAIQNKTGVAISFPAAIQTSAPHRRTDKWWPDIPGGAGGSGGLLFGPGATAETPDPVKLPPETRGADDVRFILVRRPPRRSYWTPRWQQ